MTPLQRNIAYNVAGQVVTLGLTAVAVKLIFVHLGPDVFGIIFFALTLSPLIVAALDLGISGTLVRAVAVAQARSETHEITRAFVRTAATMYWGMYIVAAFLTFLLSPIAVRNWIHISATDPGTATLILQVVAASALTALPRAYYASVLRGMQRMGIVNLIDTGTVGLQQAGSAALIAFGAGVTGVIAWLAACYGVSTLLYLVITSRIMGWQDIAPGWSLPALRHHARLASHLLALSLLQTATQQLDRLIASALLPIAVFGTYAFTAATVMRGGMISTAIYLAAVPALARFMASTERPAIMPYFRRLDDLQSYSAAAILAIVPFTLIPAGNFLFGTGVGLVLWWPASLVALAVFMQMSMTILLALTIADGNVAPVTKAYALGFVASIPCSYFGVRSFGIAGAGIAGVVFNLIAYAIIVPSVTRHSLLTSPRSWFARLWRLGLIWTATYGWLLILVRTLRPTSMLFSGAGYIVGTMLFAVASYRYGVGPELKRHILPRILRQSAPHDNE